MKLTTTEKSRIVHENSLDYELNPKGLGDEFFYTMRRNKYSIAQIDAETGEEDSYESLLQRCVRTSLKLILLGVGGSDIICLCSSNHLNSCVPIISALFLAVRLAPLDPLLSIKNTSYILNILTPKIIFVSVEYLEYIEEALEATDLSSELIVFGENDDYLDFSEILNSPIKDQNVNEIRFRPIPLIDINETAIIIFDTDNYQVPKRICLSHYCLMVQALHTSSYCNFGKESLFSNCDKEDRSDFLTVAMSFLNYHWISAITLLNCSLIMGMTRLVCSKYNATDNWSLIDKYKVDVLICSTQQANQLSSVDKPEGVTGTSLKLLLTFGLSFSKENLLKLRKLLIPMCFVTHWFALAEACGPILMYTKNKPSDIKGQYENPTSCGKLMPGFSCKIVHPFTNKILGPNMPGKFCYKCDFMPKEYRDASNLFDKRGWAKTGYVAYYDKKKRFYVLSRLDEIFKCGRWDIVPTPIETVIKEHPAVKDAVVIGIPHQNPCEGESPMGVVTLKRGMSNRVTPDDIKKYVNRVISSKQKLKAGVRIVKQIPYTPLEIPKRLELRENILQEMSVSLRKCSCTEE